MSNLTISTTSQSRSRYDIAWGEVCATGALLSFGGGFAGLGLDVRDRQIVVGGAEDHAPMAPKTTQGTPVWRPPIS